MLVLQVLERPVYSARHVFIENLRKSDPPVVDSDQISPEITKVELAGDGRPAPAAYPGDCCSLSSPTRSPGGSDRPKTDHFRVFSPSKTLRPLIDELEYNVYKRWFQRPMDQSRPEVDLIEYVSRF